MKPLMALLVLLIGCPHLCNGQGRNSFETDLVSAIVFGRIRISAEHVFCEKWSVQAGVSVRSGSRYAHTDKEEREHWDELYGNGFRSFSPDSGQFIENSISFRFWPRTVFDGPVISIGGEFDIGGIPDLTIGLGYHCPIWRNLCAAITYSAGIKDCINEGFRPAEGLRIGLSYVF